MSLQTRIGDLITAVATDYKQLRTWMTGTASGDLTALVTTDKSSLIAAINEAKSGNSGTPPTATETTQGLVELATLLEVSTGTDATRAVTAAGVRQERAALKAEILGGASAAHDTLNELVALINSAEESDVITALTTEVGLKAYKSEVYTRVELGDPDTDLAAAYAAAKA